MKSMSANLYENLTVRERIIATIVAEGRGDDAEVRRLVSSCPKQAYQITDPAFSDTMQSLSYASMAVEADLRSLALRYFIYLYKKHPDTEAYLQDMADIKAGWLAVLEELGVSTKVVGSFGAPVDPVVRSLFGRAPEPDNQSAQMYKERLSSLLSYGG
jgi:hypothetical protein